MIEIARSRMTPRFSVAVFYLRIGNLFYENRVIAKHRLE